MGIDGLHGIRLLQSKLIVGVIQIPHNTITLHTDRMGLAQPVLILFQSLPLLCGNPLFQSLPPPHGICTGFLILRRLPVELGHQPQILLLAVLRNPVFDILHLPDSQRKTLILQIAPTQLQYIFRAGIKTDFSLQFLLQSRIDLLEQLMKSIIIAGG